MTKNNNYAPAIHITPEIEAAFAPAVLDVIKNSLAPTATPEEFALFAHKAASYGLDPFKNEIFFIKYGQSAQIQFAAEAYLAKAREKEGFQPPNTQTVHDNDVFTVSIDPETKELNVTEHTIVFPRGEIIAAYCIAKRDGYSPVSVFMGLEEVEHLLKGNNKKMWTDYRADMFGKHVQKRALKKQYGLEFDNMDIPQQPKEPRDITPQSDQIDHTEHSEPQTVTHKAEPVQDNADDLRETAKRGFRKLGVTTKGQMDKFLSDYAPEIVFSTATIPELNGLIQLLKTNIERGESTPVEKDNELL